MFSQSAKTPFYSNSAPPEQEKFGQFSTSQRNQISSSVIQQQLPPQTNVYDSLSSNGGNRHGLTLNLSSLIHGGGSAHYAREDGVGLLLSNNNNAVSSPNNHSTGRFQLASQISPFQSSSKRKNTDSRRNHNSNNEPYNYYADTRGAGVQELDPLVPRHSQINYNNIARVKQYDNSSAMADMKNSIGNEKQRQLLEDSQNENIYAEPSRSSFKSAQPKNTSSQHLDQYQEQQRDQENDEIQLIATAGASQSNSLRQQYNNSRNMMHLDSSMDQTAGNNKNNNHIQDRGSAKSSGYQESMTILNRSHQQTTLLVQAPDTFTQSQVFMNAAAMDKGVMSDRQQNKKRDLKTFDDEKHYLGAKFSPPTKASIRNFPDNKSVSPLNGTAKYGNLLAVPGQQEPNQYQQQNRKQIQNFSEMAERPNFGRNDSNSQQDLQQSPTFRKRSATHETDGTPEKSESIGRAHMSHNVPSMSTFVAAKRTITLDPHFKQTSAKGISMSKPNTTMGASTTSFHQNHKSFPATTSSKQPMNVHKSRSTAKPQKQHRYYVDISDIEKMLVGATRLLERSSLDRFLQNKNNMPQQLQENSANGNFSSYIQEVAGGDQEASLMLKFIEDRTGLLIQHILQMHRADYRVYQVEDSALLTSVYFDQAKDQICNALTNLNAQISVYIRKQFQGRQGTARLGLTTEKELFNIFRQMFGEEIFGQVGNNNSIRLTEQSTLPRRVMNELWNVIQLFRCVNHSNNQQTKDGQQTFLLHNQKTLQKQIQHVFHTYQAPIMIAHLATKLLFYCRGKAFYCSEPRKIFSLHRAVFEGNLPMISRLITCKQEGTLFVDKNEIDQCGNSPLVLAIRLRNIDAVKILTDLYCSPKLNPFPQVLSAFEIAKTIKDRKIVEILMNSTQKVKQHYMEVHKDAIFRVLERLPDFSIDLNFECTSSYIPWMKHFTPNDTYHIYKQGSNLRLDMRFLGYRKLKAIEGNLTVLFKGRNSGDSEGELLLVDHVQHRVTSIFEDTTNAKIDRDLDNIMNDQDIQKKYRAEKVKIEPETDKKGKITTQLVDHFTVQKYSVNSVYTMTKFKLNNKHVEMLTKYKTFDEYLKFMKIDIFSLGNPASQGFSARRDLRRQNHFGAQDQHAMAQVSSRPQINHNFAATLKDNSLLDDIQQGVDPGSHLHTQGDLGMDHQRKRRDTSINNCKLHGTGEDPADKHSKTFRAKVCSCEKLENENANFGLTPVITKSTRRTFNASMWLCQDHPLSIETFLPLLQVLSFSSKQIRKLEQAIDRYDLPRDRFPLKAKVPIFMLVEATFQFKQLQFGRQPDEVFQVDQRVLEQQRANMQQHYQLIHDQSRKGLTFNTEEDILRQNKTLTELYKQLSLPDQDRNELESEMSDGIDQRYQEMLEDQDADNSMLLDEESKTAILAKEAANAALNNHQLNQNSSKNIVVSREFNNRIVSGGGSSSNDRLTPANEYDIAVDSASNPASRQTSTVQGSHMPSQPPNTFLEDTSNVKTARMIGSVKTMSQINERHDKHFIAAFGSTVSDLAQYSSNHNQNNNGIATQSKQTMETDQQYKKKLDANQQLIERLTGKPLSTQEYNRHTHGTIPNHAALASSKAHQSNQHQATANMLLSNEITKQTVQERKRRKKELSRLLKLRKTNKLDRSKSKEEAKMSSESKVQAMVKLAEHIGHTTGLSQKLGLSGAVAPSASVSENIIDSRLVDERPNVNETVEKRKLVSYNNPSLIARTGLAQQESAPTQSLLRAGAGGGAPAGQSKGARIDHPPPVTLLNLPDKSTSQQQSQQNLDDTEANANVDSKRSSRIMQPPFSIVKKEAGFMSGVSSGQSTQDGIGVSHMAKASTADESSGQNSETNNNSISGRSFHSITKSLYNHAVAKGLLPDLNKSTSTPASQTNNYIAADDNRQGNGNGNFTPGQFGHSALKRRLLEDQNQLQTIESEEVQGTEGTIVDRQSLHPSIDPLNNPYQSSLKNIASAMSNKGQRHPQVMQMKHSRQQQDHLYDPRAMQARPIQPMGKSADSKASKVSLQSMLRPSVMPFQMSHEEKGELINPNTVLNRLHQYVINNKESAGSAASSTGKSATANNSQIELRKKQRGHTSYVSHSKLQDAGMLSPEALLGLGGNSATTKNRIKQGAHLAAIKEEVKAAGKRSIPSGDLKYRPQTNKDDSSASLQVLLTMKQHHQRSSAQSIFATGVVDSRKNNNNRKNLSDVDVMI